MSYFITFFSVCIYFFKKKIAKKHKNLRPFEFFSLYDFNKSA